MSLTQGQGSGRYELKARLASGGMGTIHLAYDRLAQREVAYKRLTIQSESQRALRTALFQREYDMLSQLPHPNIVEVYDYGEEGGTPYYVMELLSGSDLTRLAPLPYREACRVLRDITSALALVHTRRLIHRDVSPNNVRLSADGMAKLIDFGALSPFGYAKELVGTPAFIAPECLTDAPLDQRTDLYALGALAYWALTQKTPVYARSIEDLAEAFNERPLAPSSHVAGIPRELDELVLSMLAHDPQARPTNAAYVIDRLISIADLGPEADERRVAQSYLAHPPLCGRDALLAEISAAIDDVHAGQARDVLIVADAGLGRSALLEAAALRAQLSGAVVLRAQGDATGVPFRLVRTLVEAAFALYPDLESVSSTPSSIFSYRHDNRRGTPDAVEVAERHAAVIESARSTLIEASRRLPLVLVVDDVHLADAESRALLTALARGGDRQYLALITSGLSGKSESAIYEKLAPPGQRHALAPLTKEVVGEVVEAMFGNVPNGIRLAHWLYEQAGGNTATIIDLTRMLLQRGIIRYTLGTFVLPHAVATDLASGDLEVAVLARLGDLRPEVEKLTRTLSLRTGALTAEQLAAAAELALRDVLPALEELVHRGIVHKMNDEFTFVGSSLRAALTQGLPADERKAIHLRIARALIAHPSEAAHPRFDPSFHFLQAGHEDEALALIAGIAHRLVYGQEAARWTSLLEAALTVLLRRGRSKEECLSLMLPIAASGFHDAFRTQAQHVQSALAWSADVTGMSLAHRLRRFLGGKISLAIGLLYAVTRRALTPKEHRLGALSYMLSYFIGLVCDSIAIAALLNDSATCRRYLALLEPLSVLPKNSAGYAMREFCIATTALTSGQPDRASARYAALRQTLSKPVKGLEHTQKTLYLGTLNGHGISEAGMGSPTALTLADELGNDAFFATHGAAIRASYHAVRGERDEAEAQRARAELLALRGGTSWTASVAMTVLGAYAATLTEDAIALVQVIAEFQRLGDTAPQLQTYRAICEAWLAHIRGRSESALPLFDAVLDSDDANNLPTALFNRSLHATVLNALGLHARAEEVCKRAASAPLHQGERSLAMRAVMRELAVAEAGLGRLDDAVARLEQQLAEALPIDNPLELGATHRDRARIALFAKDAEAFEEHYAAMEVYYRTTRNPCLIAQCEALVARAIRRGVRADLRTSRPSLPQSDAQAEVLDEHTVVEERPTRQSG